MTFQEAATLLLQTAPPQGVEIEQPSKNNLVLLFKEVEQKNTKTGSSIPMLMLILGFGFLVMGLVVGEGIVMLSCFLFGGGMIVWGLWQPVRLDARRWLRLSLTEQGATLYECVQGKRMVLITSFHWEGLSNILIERQQQKEEAQYPYCIHLQPQRGKSNYLFRWEKMREEVPYCANVLRALWEVQQTGTFPEHWDLPLAEEPPFTDLSNHLIED